MTQRHTKKLFGGKTAHEVHAKWGWRKPCSVPRCPGMPVIKVTSYMPAKEFREAQPHIPDHLIVGRLVQMTSGPMVRVSSQLACLAHRVDLERAAAKAPSCYLIEIDRGPTPDKLVVGRAGGSVV